MSRLFGFDLTKIEVVPDSPVAVGATKAVTRDGRVHFRAGEYRPGTPEGDRLIAHEMAHVVQLFGGRGERTGSRKEVEREADRAAHLVAIGKPAPIALRAEAAAAYAFSEGEDHDHQVDHDKHDRQDAHDASIDGAVAETHDAAADGADDRAAHNGAGADAAAKGDADEAEHGPYKAETGKPSPEAHVAEERPGDDHDHNTHGDEVGPADVAEASNPEPAEAANEPSVPGGGGGPARPQKAAPSVAGGKPEAGLPQLQGVRPDQLGPAFGQLHDAAGAEVGKLRAQQQAKPPRQMSTGAAAPPKVVKAKDAAPMAAEQPVAAKKELPDGPVKGDVPGGEAEKQARQGQATEQQRTAGEVITTIAQSIASWLTSWIGGGVRTEKNTVAMSEEETRQMSGSLDKLPTTAPDISSDTGRPPAIAMKGQARSRADKDRRDLETSTAKLQTQGRADARAPMGEDHIETTVATEELTAASVPGAEMPEAQLPTVASAGATEEVGLIAQEQSGAEIDAALARASTDVGAERGKRAEEETRARADSDQQIRELKTTADADQASARASARAEVEQARGEWQGEIDRKGGDARKHADRKVADGMAQVDGEEARANAEARQHVDEGKRKADAEKQKGEKEAEDAKAKGKEKSSGFFGWLASKAKAFFDGIKQAVSAAIDACRKAVRAVIDAARKLAMAAIDLARKAITAAIKAVGEALIAIGGALLAAFPELKARFQNAIRKTVDKAVDTVNKLAAGLKKAVQKALDMLGAALDKALRLLEKGITAVIDGANAVVQGAIKAAQAVVEMLGQWAQLIKDVASGPGAWIKNLGAAIVDGIKNHLWTALKTAVIEWFKAKVFELLGVGGIVLQLLLEGGLTREHITQMALDALIVAIPAALIMILIEKLVAMIVPAAGALMAIIEGLQAAWGTISRIIAAFAAFMAFLLAVKGGGAGPLFATLLASAAVVVLDFVSNWLLRKLMSAARKVGAKLKGMAEKFKARRKAKAPGKARDDRKKSDPSRADNDRAAKEKKDKKNQEILERAIRALQPKVARLMQRGVSRLRLRAQLLIWKLQYRLSSLSIDGAEGRLRIIAKVNPEGEVQQGLCLTQGELLTLARKVADREVRRRTSPVPRKVHDLLDQPTPGMHKRSDHEVATHDGTPVLAREYQKIGHTNAMVYGDRDGKRLDLGTYEDIHKKIQSIKTSKQMTDQQFASHMTELVKTGKMPAAFASDSDTKASTAAMKLLMSGREPTRNPVALLTGPMGHELVAKGQLTYSDLYTGKPIHSEAAAEEKKTEKTKEKPGKEKPKVWGGGGMDPMSMIGAPKSARTTYDQLGLSYPVMDPAKQEKSRGTPEQAAELQARERDILLAWLNQKVGNDNLVFKDKQTAEMAITRLLIALCREWYGKQLGPVSGRK